MPLYTFLCDDCNGREELIVSLREYEPLQKCSSCGSTEIYRDFAADRPSKPPQTLGMLAEKNSAARGYNNCIPEKTKKRN